MPNDKYFYIRSVVQVWQKCLEDKEKLKTRLREQTNELYRSIRDVLQNETSENAKMIIQELKRFLQDKDKEHKIDDCIRWLVLLDVVQNYPLEPENVEPAIDKDMAEEEKSATGNGSEMGDDHIIIIQIILETAQYLPFDNPYKPLKLPPDWKSYGLKQCLYKEMHFFKKPNIKTTPFFEAARKGIGKAVEEMIDYANRLVQSSSGNLNSKVLLDILTMKYPGSTAGERKSALSLASLADTKLGALEALLKYDYNIALSQDDTFNNALEEGLPRVVNAFLKYPELREKFVNTTNILKAIKPLEIENRPEDEERNLQNHEDVINALIEHARDTQKDIITEEVVGKIIQLNLTKVWEKNRSKIEDMPGLLHLAVMHQNKEFVKMFLDKFDNSVTSKNHHYYPLWYNNNITDGNNKSRREFDNDIDKERNKKIRDMIVTATIKSQNIDKMQELLDIFQNSDETVNELCFDLSRFNSKVYSMSNFVNSLVNHEDNGNLLSYEQTIKYAEFPVLGLHPDEKEIFGEDIHVEHDEVFRALDWLKSKGVTDIIELTVPDRLVNPHDEQKIGEYVGKFKIEVLDWKFLDMSIATFRTPSDSEGKDADSTGGNSLHRIRELHLYSSGKRAVISHWLGPDGVPSLPNLTTLEIHVVKELMTKDNCEKAVNFITDEFKKLSIRINESREKDQELTVIVYAQEWNKSQERMADLEEIADRAVPQLSRFIKSYFKHVYDITKTKQNHRSFRPIKVAVIDNGILSISPSTENPLFLERLNNSSNNNAPIKSDAKYTSQSQGSMKKESVYKTLWSRIKKGQSFVGEGSRVSSWLFASDPHGTQMANLICAIDPWCDLYVAKVTEGRSGIIPAIQWAMDQGVDIISMSFAILEHTNSLEDICKEAARRGIIMLCSTHDEGFNVTKAYPADFSDTITITACDEFGAVAQTMSQEYRYSIQGHEVAAGVVPFLESSDRISGSSVATAIAAGLSSLVLSCDRLARNDDDFKQVTRKTIITKQFGMMASDNTKYLILGKFAGIDAKIRDGTEINARSIIKEFFKSVTYGDP